jgi:ribosomal-protein-alanine N-acetyltransferase
VSACAEIPVLETARLRLRGPRIDDFGAYADFRASPRTVHVGGPFGRDTAWHQFCALAGHWMLRGFGRWMVALRDTDEPVGIVGPFQPEIWPGPELAWSLFDGAEGKGYAQEAAIAARDHAFRVLGWTAPISVIGPDNTRSIALARRLGAYPDGTWDHPSLGKLHIWRHPEQRLPEAPR